MQINKETVISVLTTSGEVINAGDTVIFNFYNKCCVGVYMGLSDRGALRFKGKIAGTDVTLHVRPKSIKEIYKADVTVHIAPDNFMNKPESEEEKHGRRKETGSNNTGKGRGQRKQEQGH